MAATGGHDSKIIDLRDRRLPDGRTLHLVDVENLMGGALNGFTSVGSALDDYESAAGLREGDHMVIAAHPAIAFLAKLSRPGRSIRPAHGKDGADFALLRDADVADLARRYDRVVVGSGDGIFAETVSRLVAAGVRVQVVSRPRSLAFQLRLAAQGEVTYLAELGTVGAA